MENLIEIANKLHNTCHLNYAQTFRLLADFLEDIPTSFSLTLIRAADESIQIVPSDAFSGSYND